MRDSGEFLLRASTPIRANADAAQAADYFNALLQRTRGPTLPLAGDGPAIEFAFDPTARDASESYTLSITPARILVAAREPAGLFYGGITLWQLLTSNARPDYPLRVPAMHIEDAPRFRWRGFMLDSARHFQSVDEIKILLDQMAQLKLNVFHWHLTDDQGWRLEIKRYPKLTEVGAWRQPAGAAGHDRGGQPPLRYGGYYTQAQARELVAYAAARHITIVPEIEMPGHAQAAIAAYPQLGVTGKAPPVSPDWGVHSYLYNVDEDTFVFLENVLSEVMEVFPGTYIHIGGDEAVKTQWRASKRVQQRMRALGVKDEKALQSWFTARIERFLSAHGRRLIGWDEILEGGLPPQATVMSWHGAQGAMEAARQGHDVILSPGKVLYLNRFQSTAADEPPGHGPLTTLHDVYAFEAVPPELDAQQARHILGAQANLWTEHVRTFEYVEHMAFPRLAALAESVWTPPAQRDWRGFLDRLAAQMQRYRELGIAAADSAFAVRFEASPLAADRALVTLSNQAQFGDIRYTLDGSTPMLQSPRYTTPLQLSAPASIRATSFAGREPLAAARIFDTAALRTRHAEELESCSGDRGMRLEDDAPRDGARAVLQINIADPCWIWKDANLDHVSTLRASVANLPFNLQFGESAQAIKLRKPTTRDGELEVHLDRCDGERIAALALAPARSNDTLTTLEGELRARAGKHDLCFFFTRPRPDPLWAIDSVQLLSAP